MLQSDCPQEITDVQLLGYTIRSDQMTKILVSIYSSAPCDDQVFLKAFSHFMHVLKRGAFIKTKMLKRHIACQL